MVIALAGREQRPDSMPPLEDAPMNPVTAAIEKQVIGNRRGDAEGVGDSRANNPCPAKSNRYVGSRQRAVLRHPPPLKSNPSQRNQSKYCRFHDESGHTTTECFYLKDEVERLIREGRLSEYQADRRGNNNRRNNNRREDQRQDHPPEPVGVIRMIFGGRYLGGTSHRAQKKYTGEAKDKFNQRIVSVSGKEAKASRYEETKITFSEADTNGVHFPKSDALVVEAMIGNHTVCRILVDSGSSVDILYTDCLDKIGIPQARLQNNTQPMYGFTGDCVIHEEMIELPMTISD
ncbi:hypothetical protein L484_016880 [Morus notabilis]|uniref:Uncharacterized protein n=1 Tax=Morus notabilis TaxID=981085 RepID=W9RKI5_9ROSA|nr:hypothetical protein L484_016880 [Morus notabilis]